MTTQFSTSRTFQALKEASYNIEFIYLEAMNFQKFMKETLIVTRKKELIMKQLASIKVVENARKIRVNQSKRVIQMKDVIRVNDCRKMTSKQKKKEKKLKTMRQNKFILTQRKR
jgi:hypothetical protein